MGTVDAVVATLGVAVAETGTTTSEAGTADDLAKTDHGPQPRDIANRGKEVLFVAVSVIAMFQETESRSGDDPVVAVRRQ